LDSAYSSVGAEDTDHLQTHNNRNIDVNFIVEKPFLKRMNIERLYKNGDIVKKREIIGSMYPENLTIDGLGVRTARLNEAVSLICSLGAGSGQKRNRTRGRKSVLSCLVTLSGFKPETF
jgi:hypothetical protein